MSIKQFKNFNLLLVCFSYLCCPVAALACTAKIQSLDLQAGSYDDYDVFTSEAYGLTQQYEAKVLFSDVVEGEECLFYFSASTFDSTTKLTSLKNESLFFEPVPQSLDSGVQNNRWFGKVSPASDRFRFQLRFPSHQFGTYGNYDALLEAKLHQLPDGGLVIDELQQLIAASIEQAAQVSFYGVSDNTYHLDLGYLSTGKVINAAPNLFVKSTTDYSLSFESMNKGVLKHQNQQSQWDIDYQLTLNNIEIDLSHNENQFYANSATVSQGERLPLKIVIGETEDKLGGIYTDEIHIYISPGGFAE